MEKNMEDTISDSTNYKLGFNGTGGKFFGIFIGNLLLTIITLGFYYPWAIAKQLKFLCKSITLNGDAFAFNGTGKEMIKGYFKVFFTFLLIFGIAFLAIYFDYIYFGIIFLYFAIILITPVLIHGSVRYGIARTSWKGIRFGYHGNRNEMFVNFFKWIYFTIITLGIYSAWMGMKMNKYIIENIRMGDMEFKFDGKGKDYFLLNLVGCLLSVITLGIYSFWYYKKVFAYYVERTRLYKDGKGIYLKSTATAGDFFVLILLNSLICIFTLGLGTPWVITRTLNFVFSKMEPEGNIDLNSINQTEPDYTDEEGDYQSNFLDVDLVI